MPPPSIHIRKATAKDIPLILNFIAKKAAFDGCPEAVEATAEKLRQTLFSDQPMASVVFVEVEGREVGFASYFRTYSTFLARPSIWLDDLYVDEAMRSQGIGKELLKYLARLALETNCGRVEWSAGTWNQRGLEFYRRQGARISETARLCRLDRDAIEKLAAQSSALNGCDLLF